MENFEPTIQEKYSYIEELISSSDISKKINEYISTGLLQYIFPDIWAEYTVVQNHPYHEGRTVFEHTMLSLNSTNDKLIRTAILFHDTGKVKTINVGKDGYNHFFNHGDESANIVYNFISEYWNILNEEQKNFWKKVKTLCYIHDKQMSKKKEKFNSKLEKIGLTFDEWYEMHIADVSGQNPEFFEKSVNSLNEYKNL